MFGKPINLGFCILDLSKLLMYEFQYQYIKIKFSTDLFLTDSLVYEIGAENIHEEFYNDKNLFAFSDYSRDSKLSDPVNKKVISKMSNQKN